MPAPSSPPDLMHESASDAPPTVRNEPRLGDAIHDDEEATVVMGKSDLPDFEKASDSEKQVGLEKQESENRPPQRPSTFTRLLLNPRR